MTTALKKEIQKMARESVREALQEEFTRMAAIGPWDDTVIFNAWRDNGGKGIPAATMVKKLRTLIRKDRAHGSNR